MDISCFGIINAPHIILAKSFNQGLILFLLIAILSIVLIGVFLIFDRYLGFAKEKFLNKEDLKGNYSIVPSKQGILGGGIPKHIRNFKLNNTPYIKLKKGFDIKIKGTPVKEIVELKASTFAVSPTDFIGISPIPKLEVQVGDEVKAGDVLFYDKKNPRIKYTAPTSGEVVEITRGAKRAIDEVIILGDLSIQYKDFEPTNPKDLDRDQIAERMIQSGSWPFLRQRPYNVLANPDIVPKAIFISAFDSAPLAGDLNFTLEGEGSNFQAGIDALGKLTSGSVHIGLTPNNIPSDTFTKTKGAQFAWFDGKHPAGNVGIQIHHIAPIVKGETVWTIHAEDVVTVGKLFTEGKYDPIRTIALGGSSVKQPKYYKTRLGANIENMIKDNLDAEHVRFISGDVLTGKQINAKGHLSYFENQLTVIEEGDQYEMFGWLVPGYMRPSASKTFPSFLFPEYEFDVNTNTNGEHRAFVVTGQYEKVLPMDIYPVHLLKSILANDFDKMEGLGIYEVVEEDLAICEFVCTSKTQVQKILREGLNTLQEQG